MAIEQDKLGLEIYKILAAKEYAYTLTMYDTVGEATTTPLKAKWIYIKPVNFMIQLPDPAAKERPEIYFWKQKGEHDVIVEQLISRMRKACNQFGVGLTVNDFAEENTPKQFAKVVKRYNEENSINESMTGTDSRSYYMLENARMVIIHGKKINEEVRGSRSRNIKEIYIETKQGERYKYPTNYLGGAKAMTQHLNHSGEWTDVVGQAICESGHEIVAINRLVHECKITNCWPIYEKAKRFVNEVKSEMKKMQGPRGYARLSESIRKKPRIGQKVIESRCSSISALTGLTESTDLLESYKFFAKRDLHEDKKNESVFTKVIAECMIDMDSRLAKNASRMVTRGDVGFAKPMRMIPQTTDTKDKVLLYCTSLADCVDDNTIAVVLSELSEKPQMTHEDAQFVAGVLKSAKLNEFKKTKSTNNELQSLNEWIDTLTKGLI